MPLIINDGVLLATILAIIEDNPKPNLLFGAPAVSIPHIASNLNVSPPDVVAEQVLDVIAPLCDTLFDTPRRAVYKELKRGEIREGWIVFEEIAGSSTSIVEDRKQDKGHEKDSTLPLIRTDAQIGTQQTNNPDLPPMTLTPRRVQLPPSPAPPLPIAHLASYAPKRTERHITRPPGNHLNEQAKQPQIKQSTQPTESLSQSSNPPKPASEDSQPKTLYLDPTLPGGEFQPKASQANNPSNTSNPVIPEKPKGLSFLKPLFLGKKNKSDLPISSNPSLDIIPESPKKLNPLYEPLVDISGQIDHGQSTDIKSREGLESSYDIIDLYDLDGGASRGRYPTFPQTEAVAKKQGVEKDDMAGFGELQEKARERGLGRMGIEAERVDIVLGEGTGGKPGTDSGVEGAGERTLVVVRKEVTNRAKGNEDDGVASSQRQKERSTDDHASGERIDIVGISPEDTQVETVNTGDEDTPDTPLSSVQSDLALNDDAVSDVESVYLPTPPPTPFLVKAFEDLPFGFDISSSGTIDWITERWQLFIAEMIVLLGLAYFIQASGF